MAIQPITVIAILLTVTAVFSWINHRFIGLPVTIGVMLIALSCSLVLLFFSPVIPGLVVQADLILQSIDFDQALMQGMLCFLLFAGALHINLSDLFDSKSTILSLATVGLLASTAIVGYASFYMLQWIGFQIPLIWCFLFGALISPTDPIAVLAILKSVGAPKALEVKISGESLFNDGIGVVVFLDLLEFVTRGDVTLAAVGGLFLKEAAGGVIFGIALGALGYYMLKAIDNYQVEALITLAVVFGGYTLANQLHISGPIAVVVAGLLIGNHGRLFAMSDVTKKHLDIFWELIDEILNAILFVLIGLEVLVLDFNHLVLIAGVLSIPLVLLARFISVGVTLNILKLFSPFNKGAVRIMTWGGLRGGISVALALSLPPGPEREIILVTTYSVVVFSILVQGLTMGRLIRSISNDSSAEVPSQT